MLYSKTGIVNLKIGNAVAALKKFSVFPVLMQTQRPSARCLCPALKKDEILRSAHKLRLC